MPVAVGLAGTGDWALAGLGPALRSLPDVDLAACASPDLAQARRFAAALAVPRVYPGLDEMLAAEPELGLIVICTPDDHHPHAIRAAAAAGVAVYCEKPLAASAGAAADLVAVAAAAGIPATVGFAFRYAAAVQRLRADLRAGVLGTPWLLELYEHNAQFHPVTGRPLTWKGDPRHAGGGALFEYGAHVVDLGCWLLGPVADVTASFATVVPAAELDDIAAVQVRYASGALGTVLASWVLPGGFPGIRVRLHGSAGTGEADLGSAGEGSERYRRWSPRGEVVTDLDLTPAGAGHGVYAGRQLRDFLGLAAGRPAGYPGTLPTITEALHVQHVLDTALRATAARLPVPAIEAAV
jgi:predicted dehydrogenase